MIILWVKTIRLALSNGAQQVLDQGTPYPGERELPSLIEIRQHDARGDGRITDLQILEKSLLLDLVSDDRLRLLDLCRGNTCAKQQECENAAEEAERASQTETLSFL